VFIIEIILHPGHMHTLKESFRRHVPVLLSCIRLHLCLVDHFHEGGSVDTPGLHDFSVTLYLFNSN